MMSSLPINLDDLLRRRKVERERIEYKAGWNPDPILRTVCAFANDFANLGGGYIVIGQDCDEDGVPIFSPVGLRANQLDPIQQELLRYCHLMQPNYFPRLSVERYEGRNLIVLWVPGGENRPYRVPKNVTSANREYRYYIRRYSSTVEARDDDERELLSLAANVPFDDRFNQQAELNDLSPRLMGTFLSEVGSDLADDVDDLVIDELGRQMNVVGGPREASFPKNVGLLFFNDEPHRFFPATQIDVVWFPDGAGGDRFEEQVFRGPLDRMTREALGFIQRNYLKELVEKFPDRAESERVWNFPYPAIEEAVVNAVYHRSYEEREPIEIRISPEELMVLSFPGPDRSIRMEDLRRGRAVSRRYRNRRIGEFLKELDLAEGRSTGIPKILRVMEGNGSPPPEFETDEDRTSFLIRLAVHPAAVPVPVGEETPQVTGEATGEVTGEVTG
ncbi:putative DNA binding domain-containing protein, partial [Candidatus Bipolaricaulota bacterium]|nr:putative DNA binding domain-containing protein [Candidatus Bipolaricaulota bacterium]